MKNQYFGDIGDYGKYGLLRFLAEHGVSVSVNWYLTPDDGSSDGRFTEYLSKEAYRKYSPIIFDALKEQVMVRGRRDVAAMEEIGLIPNAQYYRELLTFPEKSPISDRKQIREMWHKQALSVTFHRGTQRSYIFVLHQEFADAMKRCLGDFLASDWKEMFTLEIVRGRRDFAHA